MVTSWLICKLSESFWLCWRLLDLNYRESHRKVFAQNIKNKAGNWKICLHCRHSIFSNEKIRKNDFWRIYNRIRAKPAPTISCFELHVTKQKFHDIQISRVIKMTLLLCK